MRKLLVSLCIFLTIGEATPGQASVFELLNTHRLIKCSFSSLCQNRIVVEGERVKKVIYPESGQVSVKLEEESGQIFVYALMEHPSNCTFSIITDKGFVQDVELSFERKSSEVLILRQPRDITPSYNQAKDLTCDEPVISKVKTILRGKIPGCYTSCNLPHNRSNQLGCGIELELMGKFISDSDTLYLWKVKNAGNRIRALSESLINFQGGNWVYLNKFRLRPREHTLAIVGMDHG